MANSVTPFDVRISTTSADTTDDISHNLIRIWVEKYQAGGLDEDVVAADLLQTYEARIAALERLVGKQALELEFPKGALRPEAQPRSGTMSAITVPTASAS